MYPQLKAHSALWEYFECDTFLEEKYSSTVTVNMLSQRLSMDLPNHARYTVKGSPILGIKIKLVVMIIKHFIFLLKLISYQTMKKNFTCTLK